MKNGDFKIEDGQQMPVWQGSAAAPPIPWSDRPDNSEQAARAGMGSHAAPQPSQGTSSRKRVRLQTVGDVADELGKLYREARGKKLDVADASRMANMLSILSRILESSQLEKRIEALEQRGALH